LTQRSRSLLTALRFVLRRQVVLTVLGKTLAVTRTITFGSATSADPVWSGYAFANTIVVTAVARGQQRLASMFLLTCLLPTCCRLPWIRLTNIA
jgi:hypothetical protein